MINLNNGFEMIYIITDPRENRQEVYVGYTDNLEVRQKSHIKESLEYSGLDTRSSVFNRNSNTSKQGMKESWIKRMFNSGYKPNFVIVDQNNDYSEEDWIKTFANSNYILMNQKVDIFNAINNFNQFSNAKLIPDDYFNSVVNNLQSKGFLSSNYPKILIDEYQVKTKYASYEAQIFTYPSSNLSELEAIRAESKYQDFYRYLNYEGDDYSAIFKYQLYILDEEFKSMVVRDFYDNDLLMAVLEKELYDDVQATSICKDIELILNNGHKLNDSHKFYFYENAKVFSGFKRYIHIFESYEFNNELNKLIQKKENYSKTLKI